MKPTRIEFTLTPTIYGQPMRLVRETTQGRTVWSIYRDAADQRDDSAIITGIPPVTLQEMAAAVTEHR